MEIFDIILSMMKKIRNLILTVLLVAMQLPAMCLVQKYQTNDLRSLFLNNEAIIYGINIRSFNSTDLNGDDLIDPEKGEKTGTFINAIERLDELKGYGINTVHVLPITPVGKVKSIGTAGSLYAMTDLTKINPQLNDPQSNLSILEQAKLFVDECHKRNIRVIIDLPSCGSYEWYLKRPDLFILDKKQEPVIPADWTDVRLLKTQNPDNTLNEEVLDLHKKFINLVLTIGADGVRADVATIKPYEFWVEIIKYARERDPEFLFLAEASDSWTTPPSKYGAFTDYKKLLEAGFDGYYGSYFNFKKWKKPQELNAQVILNQGLSKAYGEKKSVIGSFATHDEQSPILSGGEKLTKMMIWLNATLPLNPYYIDGFVTGDNYLYKYANKKAIVTYTDDDYYYVHRGKLDIFNYSRKPSGGNKDLETIFIRSMELRRYSSDAILKGSFKLLKANNDNIFAYIRQYETTGVIVIMNKDFKNKYIGTINVPKISPKNTCLPICLENAPEIDYGKIHVELNPGEVIVLAISNMKK